MPGIKFSSALLLPGRESPRPRWAGRVQDNPAMQAIWDTVCLIPRGHVSTYGAVARAAGLPGRARLAGLAMKMAPPELRVPWHRVLGAGGRIVFPESSAPYREQARLLRAEGVRIRSGRVHPSCLVAAV